MISTVTRNRLITFALYLGAIVLANYLITKYGQAALPFVSFCLIPFDLVARDLLQDQWSCTPGPRYKLILKMALVILAGAILSWVTGTGSLKVNIASCLAFMVAGTIDALTYQWMIQYGRILRINGATLTAAITDSIIFVAIAFNEINWYLVGLQIAMKVAGGFVWSLLLYRLFLSKYERVGRNAREGFEEGLRVRKTIASDIPPVVLKPNQRLRVRVGYPRMEDFTNDTPWVGFWLEEKLGNRTYSYSYFLLPPVEDIAVLQYVLGRMGQELQRIIDREHYTINPSQADLTVL